MIYIKTAVSKYSRVPLCYIARQMYGITLLVPPFCLTAVWNQCQCKHKAPENILKNIRDPLTKLFGRPSLLSSLGPFSFSGELISPIALKWRICVAYIQLWVVAVCKLPSPTKLAVIPTNIWPVIIENMVRVSGLGLKQELLCHRVSSIKSHAVFVTAVVLPRAYIGIY